MAFDLEDIQAGQPPRSLSQNAELKAADQTRVQKPSRTNAPRRGRSGWAARSKNIRLLRSRKIFFLALAVILVVGGTLFYRAQRMSRSNPSASLSVSGSGEAPASPAASTAIAAPETPPAAPLHVNAPVVGTPVGITVHDPFSSATLTIWVDDKIAYQHRLSGQTKKRMWVVKSVEGDFSGAMLVPAGKHALRVQVSSEHDHYFGVVRVAGEFAKGSHKTLSILFHGHEHEMSARLD
jgi:hypothetical protein